MRRVLDWTFDVRLLIHLNGPLTHSWSIDLDEVAYDAMDDFNRNGHEAIWQDVSVHWGQLNSNLNSRHMSDEVLATRRGIAIAEEVERRKVQNSA